MSRKIITTEETEEDKKIDGTLRPQYLKDYIGQEKIKSTLKIFIDAAKRRGEALDHVLFYGTWKDNALRDHRERDGRESESDLRSRDRETGGDGRDLK